jgi:4-diphosphocytidyl-2-C-methyl-D-erythritol kinase
VPQEFGLSTADVYREADRLGLPRTAGDLAERREAVERAARAGGAPLPNVLAMNDLGRAALSLAPSIEDSLAGLRDAGAEQIVVCGSGPTAAGVLWGEGSSERAGTVADRLRLRFPRAVAAFPAASAASTTG